MKIESLMLVKEVAEIFRVREFTVCEWARAGRIPCVRLSARDIRFNRNVIQNIVNGNLQMNEPESDIPKKQHRVRSKIKKGVSLWDQAIKGLGSA
jgi:hypothetical protein